MKFSLFEGKVIYPRERCTANFYPWHFKVQFEVVLDYYYLDREYEAITYG